jgi:integrase
MAKAKLTRSAVDKATTTGKLSFIWDTEQSGLALQITPAGIKSFVFKYRTPEGDTARVTIGKYCDSLTLDQARKRAKDLHRDVLTGIDPRGEKKKRREAITVNQLLDQYLASPTFAKKADSTKSIDKGRIERHVRPLLGREYADKLTPDSIKKAQRAITEGKTAGNIKTIKRGVAKVTGGAGTADKAVLVLRAAYSWAIEESMLTDNPAAKIKIAQAGQRDTILNDSDEYGSLFKALDRMETEHRIRRPVADAIRFIALTGARRGEVINLQWQWVDLRAGQVVLPPAAHKTGNKTGKPRIIALPAQAQAIIARQPEGKPDGYVFQPAKGEGPMSLNHPWGKVRAEAKLPAGLGLHGLRHSIATHLAMSGASNVELMEALGHKQVSTTQRYIHFAQKSRSTLAERAASVAVAGMDGKTVKAKTVPIRNTGKSKTAA